jgi:preprotein translocase subunit SecA
LNFCPQPQRAVVQPVRREGPKIGRNDPCPCGSGQKFKKCHGTALEEEGASSDADDATA